MQTKESEDSKQYLSAYKKGNELAELGEFEDALVSYELCLKLNSSYWQGHFKYGNSLLALGRSTQACKAYARAVILNSKCWEAWKNLSVSLCSEKKFPEALKAAQKYVSLQPESSAAYLNRGIVFIDSIFSACRRAKNIGSAECTLPTSQESSIGTSL